MLGETVPDAKAKPSLNTLGNMKSYSQMHTLQDTLAEAEAETLGNTSKNV